MSTWSTATAIWSPRRHRGVGCKAPRSSRLWVSALARGPRCSGWIRTPPLHWRPDGGPRTTLTPTIVLRDGKPFMAFGTPGGDQQDQWALTLFARLMNHGLNLQEGIDAPMFHTNHVPESFWPRPAKPGEVAIEGRFPAETIAELRRRGHAITEQDDWSIGRLTAVASHETEDGRVLKAGANPRGMQGYAVGR